MRNCSIEKCADPHAHTAIVSLFGSASLAWATVSPVWADSGLHLGDGWASLLDAHLRLGSLSRLGIEFDVLAMSLLSA
jgi:hypothetical protein